MNKVHAKINLDGPWPGRLVIVLWVISIGAVCILSLTPEVEFPLDFRFADIMYHGLAYLWLSALPFFGFQDPRRAFMSSFLMIPLGVGLEIAQYFVPGRFLSGMDMLANGLGACLGLICGKYLRASILNPK